MIFRLVTTMIKLQPWVEFFFFVVVSIVCIFLVKYCWLLLKEIAIDLIELYVRIKTARSDQLKREVSDLLSITPYLTEFKQTNELLTQMAGDNGSSPQKMDVARKALIASKELQVKSEKLSKAAYQLITGE